MPDVDAADVGPALGQTIEGRYPRARSRTMDDMSGYGSRRGRGNPADRYDSDGDRDGDGGFAGEASDVTKHPQVDHNGHRGDARGQCVGCGSARCMGGCGSGAKRM